MAPTAFAEISAADWQALVAQTLGGRDPAVLTARSDDGIAIGPIYGPAAAGPLPWRAESGAWQVVQRIDHAETGDALAALNADRAGGVDRFEMVFNQSPAARGAGLAPASAEAIARAIADSGCRALRIDAGEETPAVGARFRATMPAGCAIVSDFDPIATLAARGFLLRPYESHAAAVTAAAASDPSAVAVVADGRIWHAGGATEAQELSAVLATFAAYLRLFQDVGRADGAISIGIALAADADQFMTVAKFRAMRLLHARLIEAGGLPSLPARIHGSAAWRMMSRLDPHTNILRVTSAAFAAGIGGADSVAALPFDAALGTNDPFARRIARNCQSILLAESGLGHVADPGAGSGAIEYLSQELAAAAWELFRAIERDGGMLAAVRSGTIQRAIAAAREERLDRVRRSEIALVGVNVYRNPVLAPLPMLASGVVAMPAGAAERVEALRFIRLAAPFEEAAQ